jgi:hypothetical protein
MRSKRRLLQASFPIDEKLGIITADVCDEQLSCKPEKGTLQKTRPAPELTEVTVQSIYQVDYSECWVRHRVSVAKGPVCIRATSTVQSLFAEGEKFRNSHRDVCDGHPNQQS